MTLLVSELAQADELAYEAFVAAQPFALMYHGLQWRNLLKEFLGCRDRYLLARGRDGSLEGVLPVMESQGRWGTVLNSLPFYGSNGGVIASSDAARDSLHRRYGELASNAAAATLIDTPLLAPGEVVQSHSDFRVGQITPIGFAENHAAALMASFHFKTRNAIRKAEKIGITVSRADDALGFVASVHAENMAAIGGKAKPHRFFDLVPRHFAAGRDFRIYLAHDGAEPVAALLAFYFSETVEYFTPVVREQWRESQALSLINYRAMCDASKEGWRRWNWGGTWASQDGVYRFKSRWGTGDHHYHYHVQVNEPGLLASTRAELESEYPYFYVLPYSILDLTS